MRRALLRVGLVGVGLILVSGIGTAEGGEPPSTFRSEWRPVTRAGLVGTDVAPAPAPRGPRTPPGPVDVRTLPARRSLERRSPEAPLSGRVPDGPLPVPDMPAPGAQSDVGVALDTTPLPTPAPALDQGFEALPDDGTALPPDTHGAAGPTKLMTVLNTQVRVQERNGTVVSTTDLDTFWSGTATAGVFDPRVVYDPDPAYGQGRWIWTAAQGARTGASGILIGASTSEEPAVGYGYLIDADASNLAWADYPTVGFNRNWVVVQVNLFRISDDSFYLTHIYVFDKAELYTGTVSGATLFYSGILGGTQVPAATYDYTVDDLYLLQRWSSSGGQLRMYRIFENGGPDLNTGVGYPSTDPWADAAPGGSDFAPQVDGPPGCAAAPCAPNCRIQANDSRIQNVVYRNGTLWATHTVFYPSSAPTRSSVQWWEIDTTATVLQRGLVDDPLGQRFYAFPSIAVNRHGDVLLGYSSFEGSDYAGARYSFRNAYDEANRLRAEALLKDGEACYYKAPAGRNRWGDYSATVVDALDDTGLWTIQEYAATPGAQDRWGTWWGAIDATRTLSISDASVAEGASGTTALDFTVTLSEPTVQEVTVEWSTADVTATAGDNDYVAVSGSLLTFAPGDTTRTVTVLVNGDVTYESDETLLVNLSNPANATLADGQAEGTILNDDSPPKISISDVMQPEGDGGLGATAFVFSVTLSNPSAFATTVTWGTSPAGTATPGNTLAEDYYPASGGLTFSPGDVAHTATVLVHGDTNTEVTETFPVVLSSPSGGTILKGQGTGTILDDDATALPGVESLVVISDGNATAGRNRLQWRNPAAATLTSVRVRWELAPGDDCTGIYPTASSFVAGKTADVSPVVPGANHVWPHEPLTNEQTYCYSVWAEHSPGGFSSSSDEAPGRPFDATAPGEFVAWTYSTGYTTMPPPTVGVDGILAPSNDLTVHAMTRGLAGGLWPSSWSPVNLGSPAQQRSPIVPLAGINRAYFTTQDGRVHSVDAKTGALLWSIQLTPSKAQAAPAGIFTAWGGAGDYILVGTSDTSGNAFYALDPFTGAVIDRYPGPGDVAVDLGPILSSASVDYARGLVYFASQVGVSTETLWCLKLGPMDDALSFEWKTPGLGDISGSPTLRGSRLYVGTDAGVVWSVDAATGNPSHSYVTGDASPIDFVFPDRSGTAIYFSTANTVWGLADLGSSFGTMWEDGLGNPYASIPLSGFNPSTVLLWPGTGYLYVGVKDRSPFFGSSVLQIRVDALNPRQDLQYRELEDESAALGPPSLDLGPPALLHVGSEKGILYAVEVPFGP